MAAWSTELEMVGPSTLQVALRGTLGAGAEAALLDAVTAGVARGVQRLLLDAAGLEGMDGRGLTRLAIFCTRASRAGLKIGVCGLGPRSTALWRSLGFETVLEFHASRSQALGRTAGAEPEPAAEPCGGSVWADPGGRVQAALLAAEATGNNVTGRRAVGPLEGFGQLWHKTYRARLGAVSISPSRLTALLRERLSDLWPEGNRVVFPERGVVPGAVGEIRLQLPGGLPMDTGMRVLHADRDSFTFITLAGHMEAGWITFGGVREASATVALVESLARTGDPLFELGFHMLGHAAQEGFWRATLERLATSLDTHTEVQVSTSCIDDRRQWQRASGLRHNAAVHSTALLAGGLLRRLTRPGRPR